MNIGQIIYNLQDYIMSNSYISTSSDNPLQLVPSTDIDYETKKIDIYNQNLVTFYGANKFTKLGIQAPPNTKFKIDNSKIFTTGQTGIYELNDFVEIKALNFIKTNELDLYNVIIDFFYE